ncbi:hypothetical protein AAFG13_36025 [Bradyrhizobium sp. B124]|uniref:hypothetical protein n=1 Tax=Bradyrhizobium sp. B124 TaxID=3140245 RepID=UPI0031832D2D
MDPHNFDPSNVAASSEVQHALMDDQQADRAEQEAFEQQMAAARLADWAMPDWGSRGSLRPNVSSDGQQSRDELMDALARSNLLSSEEVVINDEHGTAELRPVKKPRIRNNPQGVPLERQLGEIANSSGGGGAMPSALALQSAHSTGIVITEKRDKRPLYSEDGPVILSLEAALIKGGMTATPARQYASSLLNFSRWLFANNRASIVARLDSEALSDDGDVREFTAEGKNNKLLKALNHLRKFRSTGVTTPVIHPGRETPPLYAEDVPVISSLEESLIEAGMAATTVKPYVGSLRSFSRWLFAKDKPSIAARLKSKSLSDDGDVIEFTGTGSRVNFFRALNHLRTFWSTGAPIGRDTPPLYAEDVPVISSLEEALIEAGMAATTVKPYVGSLRSFSRWLFAKDKPSIVARLKSESLSDAGDVFEFTGTASRVNFFLALNHLRTFWSTGAPIGRGTPPLYAEDVPVISSLEEALIEAGMAATTVEQYVGPLRSFSRWLFAKDKPSIAARLKSESLSDAGDVFEFTGTASRVNFFRALNHLRTFWSTGAPIGRGNTKSNPPPQKVARVNSEKAVRMEPKGVGNAAAQHSAWQEAGRRPEQIPRPRDDQPAPSVFVQEHVAFDPEQMSPGKLRRVLEHLDDQSMPSPADPEGLLRLEQELRQDIQAGQNNQPAPSFAVGPDFDSGQLAFEPEELRQLLDDEPAPSGVASNSGPTDQWAHERGPLPNLSMYLPLDFQHSPKWASEEHVAFDPEQMSPAELRRVLEHLDDQSMPSPADPEGLLRLEQELRQDIQAGQNNQPAPSFAVGPDFDTEQLAFEPEELRQLLDDEPAPSGVASNSGPADQWAHERGPLPNLSMYLPLDFQHSPKWASEEHVAFDPKQMSPAELRRVLEHPDDQSMPSPADPEGLLRLEQELRQDIQAGQNNQPAPSFAVGPDSITEQLTFEAGGPAPSKGS